MRQLVTPARGARADVTTSEQKKSLICQNISSSLCQMLTIHFVNIKADARDTYQYI